MTKMTKKGKRIYPTAFFWTQFPRFKGKGYKFYLLSWLSDTQIRVAHSWKKSNDTYGSCYFRVR